MRFVYKVKQSNLIFKLGKKYQKNSAKAEIMAKLIVRMRNQMHTPTEERCTYNDKCTCQLYGNSSDVLRTYDDKCRCQLYDVASTSMR